MNASSVDLSVHAAACAVSFAANMSANLGALGFRRSHAEPWRWLRAETAARPTSPRENPA